MKKNNKAENAEKSVSHGFKISMVILLFALTSLRLIWLFHFPAIDIISDKVLLFVVLVIVTYLWIREVKDYHTLLRLNRELWKTHEELKQAEIDTIASLIKAEEAKDLYTRGHSERVTQISLAVAEEMKLASEVRQRIERAGVLHDIGKIGIYDAILFKKDKLTNDEWEIIKRHPQTAVEILKPLKFLSAEREIILAHHERYDGKGYPYGYRGSEIRLEALILAVADTFDAMNSRRYYRDRLDRENIIAELSKARGTQHSPQVIDALFELLKKRPQIWKKWD